MTSSTLIVNLTILLMFSVIGRAVCQRNATFEVNFPVGRFAWNVTSETLLCTDPFESSAITFSRSRPATVPRQHKKIGNGQQLQCQDSDYCSSSAPSTVFCVPKRTTPRQWLCTTTVYDDDLSDINIRCQVRDWPRDCAYADTCVMFHSLERRSSSISFSSVFVWLAIGFAIFFFVLAVCACVRRRNRNRPSGLPATIIRTVPAGATVAASTTTYMPPQAPPGTSHAAEACTSPSLPYQPSYTTPYQSPPGVLPEMQHPWVPYRHEVSMMQPAVNPAFSGDYPSPGIYDPPPPYHTTSTGYPAK